MTKLKIMNLKSKLNNCNDFYSNLELGKLVYKKKQYHSILIRYNNITKHHYLIKDIKTLLSSFSIYKEKSDDKELLILIIKFGRSVVKVYEYYDEDTLIKKMQEILDMNLYDISHHLMMSKAIFWGRSIHQFKDFKTEISINKNKDEYILFDPLHNDKLTIRNLIYEPKVKCKITLDYIEILIIYNQPFLSIIINTLGDLQGDEIRFENLHPVFNIRQFNNVLDHILFNQNNFIFFNNRESINNKIIEILEKEYFKTNVASINGVVSFNEMKINIQNKNIQITKQETIGDINIKTISYPNTIYNNNVYTYPNTNDNFKTNHINFIDDVINTTLQNSLDIIEEFNF